MLTFIYFQWQYNRNKRKSNNHTTVQHRVTMILHYTASEQLCSRLTRKLAANRNKTNLLWMQIHSILISADGCYKGTICVLLTDTSHVFSFLFLCVHVCLIQQSHPHTMTQISCDQKTHTTAKAKARKSSWVCSGGTELLLQHLTAERKRTEFFLNRIIKVGKDW